MFDDGVSVEKSQVISVEKVSYSQDQSLRMSVASLHKSASVLDSAAPCAHDSAGFWGATPVQGLTYKRLLNPQILHKMDVNARSAIPEEIP